MKFKCELQNVTTLKKGMKITLAVPDEEVENVLKDIHRFMKMPLIVDISVDNVKRLEELKQITEEQRKKIYAIYKDIEAHTGQDAEDVKKITKESFKNATGKEIGSLSNCSHEIASEYIDYLIKLCNELGVTIMDKHIDEGDNITPYLKMCIKDKKCAICGEHGTVYGSPGDMICLCDRHAKELVKRGKDGFCEKYHVYGV